MNAKFQLILTSDYEVWGNGSGCVNKCVIEPTERMMRIAEKFDAKITFFFDVCEYWAFNEIETKGGFKNNYAPATLMREQLRDAVKRGHDVQLHFHPQWLNYKFISNQSWELDNRYWQLPMVDNYHTGEWNVDLLFKKGIDTLTNLFRGVKEDYTVHSFRAGAWCIQPSEKVIKALIKYNVKVDSTVIPNASFDNGQTKYNFKNAPLLAHWKVSETDINKQSELSELIEIPITAKKLNFFELLISRFIKLPYLNQIFPEECEKKADSNLKLTTGSLRQLFAFVSPQYRMLNYSDGTSFFELKRVFNKAVNEYKTTEVETIPLVAISHPKSFGLNNSLDRFLDYVQSTGIVQFSTYAAVIKNFKN